MSQHALHRVSEQPWADALEAPPDRDDPNWHEWAERQTVLRLTAQLRERRARKAKPAPPPPLRLVRSAPSPVIRIHRENLDSARA